MCNFGCRSHVTLYSHENQGSYAILDKFDKAQPVSKLLAKFVENGWGSKKNLDERKIAIRFMVVKSEVVSPGILSGHSIAGSPIAVV